MPVNDTTLRLRSPGELVATLPYLLGHRVEDSLVVLALHERRLGMIQRLDLPGREARATVREAVDEVHRNLTREDPRSVMVMVYEPQQGVGTPVRRAVTRMCRRHGWPVQAEVVIRGERWWLGEEQLRGPGYPVPTPAAVPAVAECVLAGMAPLPGRQSLARLFDPGPRAAVMGEQIDAVRRERARSDLPAGERHLADALAWRQWLATGAMPAQAGSWQHCLANCVIALEDRELRDALLVWLAPGLLPSDQSLGLAWQTVVETLGPLPSAMSAASATSSSTPPPGDPVLTPQLAEAAGLRSQGRDRLIEALQLIPAEHQAPMLTVYAGVAWWHGQGALAAEAVGRASELDPSYLLATLLQEMIRLGLRFGEHTG